MLDRGLLKHPQTWPGAFNVEYVKDNPYPYHFNCPAPLCWFSIVAATEELRDKRAAEHPCPWYRRDSIWAMYPKSGETLSTTDTGSRLTGE